MSVSYNIQVLRFKHHGGHFVPGQFRINQIKNQVHDYG
jgi:hypothetical protein